jgi:hypothetical protein
MYDRCKSVLCLIYGPGQLWEMRSLQNRYGPLQTQHLGFWALGASVFESLARVLAEDPNLLIPSHGVVMSEPRVAFAASSAKGVATTSA